MKTSEVNKKIEKELLEIVFMYKLPDFVAKNRYLLEWVYKQ